MFTGRYEVKPKRYSINNKSASKWPRDLLIVYKNCFHVRVASVSMLLEWAWMALNIIFSEFILEVHALISILHVHVVVKMFCVNNITCYLLSAFVDIKHSF